MTDRTSTGPLRRALPDAPRDVLRRLWHENDRRLNTMPATHENTRAFGDPIADEDIGYCIDTGTDDEAHSYFSSLWFNDSHIGAAYELDPPAMEGTICQLVVRADCGHEQGIELTRASAADLWARLGATLLRGCLEEHDLSGTAGDMGHGPACPTCAAYGGESPA